MSVFPEKTIELAERVVRACEAAGLRIVTAESCTGGLIAAALTEIPGASNVVERGFVAYSYAAKTELLGVPADLIEAHGAVSREVAQAMAEGALARAPAELSVAITGIAGPGGATPAKPVGLVQLAAARKGAETLAERHVFGGDRGEVRLQGVQAALELLLRQVR
ncbi:MAG: CinA family protein [Proteobacteria bacterium]|nr:CinA family protein [Pseudomonadota bacterium]MCH9049839.1 CinA family protein [Pseudomonadota bacterium]